MHNNGYATLQCLFFSFFGNACFTVLALNPGYCICQSPLSHSVLPKFIFLNRNFEQPSETRVQQAYRKIGQDPL